MAYAYRPKLVSAQRTAARAALGLTRGPASSLRGELRKSAVLPWLALSLKLALLGTAASPPLL